MARPADGVPAAVLQPRLTAPPGPLHSPLGAPIASLRIGLYMRLILTAWFIVLNGASLMVMMLAMTFNVGILLAILVGEVSGLGDELG